MMEAPNRIRELRMQAGLSQQALGDAVGVSKMTISDLERGNMRLDTEYMRRLSKELNVLPADLLSKSDNPDALSPDERRFLEQLRHATDEQRQQLLKMADVIAPLSTEDVEEVRKRA
jgi:HTH-type transcriptional regulator/antitoxin HipB